MFAKAASDDAKQYGAAIDRIDQIYDFVNDLNEKDLDSFLRLMQSCTQDKGQPVYWCGYIRALRYGKFGTNPNPYAPKFNAADLLTQGETDIL